MKKGALIFVVLLIFVILIISFRTNWITGAVVLDTTKLIENNYTSQILDLIQKNIDLSLKDKGAVLNSEELRKNAERDLEEVKRLKTKLDSIEIPEGYEEVHSHLKKNYNYLSEALELAIESSEDENETKLKRATDYIRKANEEMKSATELLRNI